MEKEAEQMFPQEPEMVFLQPKQKMRQRQAKIQREACDVQPEQIYTYAPEMEQIENEVQEENNMTTECQVDEENSVSCMKVQVAQKILTEATKKVIKEMESHKALYETVRRSRMDLSQENMQYQNKLEELKRTGGQLNDDLQRIQRLVGNTHEKVQNNEEVTKQLQYYVQHLKDATLTLKLGHTEFHNAARNQHTKAVTSINNKKVEISKYQQDIAAAEAAIAAIANDSIHEENRQLQEEITKKYKLLEELRISKQNADEKHRLRVALKRKEEELEVIEKGKNNIVERKKEKELQLKLVDELVNTLSDVEIHKTDMQEKIHNTNEEILNVKKAMEEVTIQYSGLCKQEEELRSNMSELKDPSNEIIKLMEDQAAVEKDYAELEIKLASAKKFYYAQIETKNLKMLKKLELSKIEIENEGKLSRVHELEKQIDMKKERLAELEQELGKLKADDRLDKIEKENAFLISSKSFLEQKESKLEKDLEEQMQKVKPLQERYNVLKEKINEKEKVLAKLDLKARQGDSHSQSTSGILKTSLPSRSSVSPKKVQFADIPLSESSTETENKKPTFNDLLAKFEKST